MKISRRTKRYVSALIEIVAESYDRDISESAALEALVNYGFLRFLKELPDIEFREEIRK